MDKKGIIICGFAGIGKSSIKTACPYYEQVSLYDLASHDFVKHNGWEKNYIECALALQKKYDYVFLSTHDNVISELMHRNIGFYVVYPFKHCKDEYLERFVKRGNDRDYIKRFMIRWDTFVDRLDNLPLINKIPLRRGQYLSDVLNKLKSI